MMSGDIDITSVAADNPSSSLLPEVSFLDNPA